MKKDRRPVEVEDLYEITLVGDAQASPDGTRVAYLHRTMDREQDNYVTNIWIWEDGANRQFTTGGKDGSPRWSPQGDRLAFISKRDGSDTGRLFVMPAAGGEAQAVTEKDWEVSSIAWSPDGRCIAFARGVPTDEFGVPKDPDSADEAENGKDGKKKKPSPTKLSQRLAFKADGVGFIHNRRQHIFVIDLASRETTQVTDGDFHDGYPAWSPDGAHIVFSSNRNADWDVEIDSQIWEVDSAGGDPGLLVKQRGSWARPVYSPTGKQLAFLGEPIDECRPVKGFQKLWRANRNGSRLTDLTGEADLEVGSSVITDTKLETQEPFFWDEDGIWFVAADSGAANAYRWNNGISAVSEGRHDVRDFSVAAHTLAYTCSDLTHPAEVFRLPTSSRSPTEREPHRLTDFNRGFLDTVKLSTPEPFAFDGSERDRVQGWIMKPVSGESPHPLVLYIHGGPQAAYGDTFFHEMQVLAGRGFGVMLINPHGSGSLGEKWVSSIHGDWGNRDFEDVMKAADMAAALDWVDENRLAIAGGSYGGYMTAWAIGHTDRFAAAVVERALVNMLSFVGTTDVPNWWSYAWKATIDTDPMKLWRMSPVAYLEQMRTPTLVIHSENDHRCPVEQGEQIFTGLRKQGVPARFVRFPEESHGLSRGGKPSRRVERLNEIIRWLEKYLQYPA